MIKIAFKRLLVVIVQYFFIFYISVNIDPFELGKFYGAYAIAAIPLVFIWTIPQYVFTSNISKNNISRKKIAYTSNILIFFSILIFFLGYLLNGIIILALCLLSLNYFLQLERIYFNSHNFTDISLNSQIIEQILKILLLFFFLKLKNLAILDIFVINFITSIFLILLFKKILINSHLPNSGKFKKLNIEVSIKDFFNLTISSFINVLFINSFKLYLEITNNYKLLAIIGLVHQVFGTIAQNLNMILQIQYGNKIYKNKKLLMKTIKPTFILIIICLISIPIINYSNLRIFLPPMIIEVSTFLFMFIFFIETYTISLNYLSKYFINLNIPKKIFTMHFYFLFIPVLFSPISALIFNLNFFILPLIIGVFFLHLYLVYLTLLAKNLR